MAKKENKQSWYNQMNDRWRISHKELVEKMWAEGHNPFSIEFAIRSQFNHFPSATDEQPIKKDRQ